jgi:non-specific serine/threonine protein kinase/serine/threonine-protein kinase
MRSDEWPRIKAILNDVLALDVSERVRFLDSQQLDNATRAELESLLAFETEAEDAMKLSAVAFAKGFLENGDAPQQLTGQQIGNYRILREIGYGGMGVVYLAERADGKFDQRVALKLLKRELNTASLRRRFEHEREILASLEHPNIARLLDAGTTDDQVPYIAMENVEGLPIDVYCERNELELGKRLDLFRKVCLTVNFAHRNLVVHRDLKPSNILVNDEGVPKLLDFGISKVLSEANNINDSATVTNLGVMTPSYASPEQLQGKSVTTASDIYSLGVILYEMLSGHRPFEDQEEELREIFKAVLERDPRPPSELVNTISREYRYRTSAKTEIHSEAKIEGEDRSTGTDALRLTASSTFGISANNLKGDLDNIVLKALRKEPDRRYSSAENFAEDIHRHQRGLPVTARPNTFTYRVEKFFIRNKAGVIGGGLVIIAIIAGVIATVWQGRVAQTEREKAEQRFNDVRKLANSYLFDVYPEIENLEGSLKAREKILTNALEYLDRLAGEAAGDRALQTELATAYEKVGDVQGALTNSSLGNIKAGLESYRKAQKLREDVLAAEPANIEAKEKLANNYYTTARTLWNNSETAAAEAEFEKALKLRRELAAAEPASVEFRDRLAVLLIDYAAIPAFNAQAGKAVQLTSEAGQIVDRLRNEQPENSNFKKTLARLLRLESKPKAAVGDYDGALRGLEQALELSRQLAAEFPTDFRIQRSVWLTNSMTCELFIDKESGKEAVQACVPTIEFPKTAHAKEPENGVVAYDLAISHFNTSRAYRLADDLQKTIEHGERAKVVMTELSKKDPENMEYKRNLAVYDTEIARAYLKLSRFLNAATVLQGVIDVLIPISEADHETTTYRYDLAIAYRMMAQAYSGMSNKPRAVETIDKAIPILVQLRNENAQRDSDSNLIAEMESERAAYAK